MKKRPRDTAKRQPEAAAPIAGPPRFYPAIGLALILLATLVIYFPALTGTPLWDDDANLTRPDLRSLAGLSRIWFEPGATQQYYPLLHTAFWTEHRVWGDSWLGYHLTNVFWHSISVLLVYSIVARLRIPGALLAAAIFALHPVMVESVAWITEQKNTLSMVFYLASLRAYLEFDSHRRRSLYCVSLFLFVLALFSKSAIVTLPAALLVIFWWQRGTISVRRDCLPLVPFFIAAFGMGLLTCWVEWNRVGAVGHEFEFSLAQRILLAGRAIWFYVGKMAWPANLVFMYPQWKLNPNEWWQWLYPTAAIATTIALWMIRKLSRAPLAGWLFFCGTLLPMLGLLNQYLFRYTFVSDHFQYVAGLGLIVPASAGIVTLLRRARMPAAMLAKGLVISALCLLAVLSWRQSHIYADGITLYQSVIARNPECWMALNNLGSELQHSGKVEKGIEHLRKAIVIKPDNAEIYNNLGFALTASGRGAEAVVHLKHALQLDPNYGEAHNNLGLAFAQSGHMPEAIAQYRAALALAPNNPRALTNVGIALMNSGHLPEAVDSLRAALAIVPDDPLFMNNLANALARTGAYPEAREHAEHALQLRPEFAEGHSTLGLALIGMGDAPGAIAHFEHAIRLRPDDAEARTNLGEILRQTGRPQEAIEQFRAALQIRPDMVTAHDNLGVALAAVGNMSQAIEQFRLAIQLNPEDANARGNLGMALVATNKLDEAIEQFKEAVRLRPNSVDLHNKLGEALRQDGRLPEAIEHYQTAQRLQPDAWQAHANLAQVFAAADRSKEASAAAEKAIEVAHRGGDEVGVQQVEEWLKHYQTELRRSAEAASSGRTSQAPGPAGTQ